MAQDVTARKALEEQLTHRAFHDSLTGLANRALFRDRVECALSSRDHEPEQVAVLFIDLDNFKVVNDRFGHAEGDRLLVSVAGRLLNATRGCDTVGRLGGDEFAILLPSVRDGREATVVAQRVVTAMNAPFHVGGTTVEVGASVGLALGRVGDDAEDLLHNADAAMYRAKAGGRGRYEPSSVETHAGSVVSI